MLIYKIPLASLSPNWTFLEIPPLIIPSLILGWIKEFREEGHHGLFFTWLSLSLSTALAGLSPLCWSLWQNQLLGSTLAKKTVPSTPVQKPPKNCFKSFPIAEFMGPQEHNSSLDARTQVPERLGLGTCQGIVPGARLSLTSLPVHPDQPPDVFSQGDFIQVCHVPPSSVTSFGNPVHSTD